MNRRTNGEGGGGGAAGPGAGGKPATWDRPGKERDHGPATDARDPIEDSGPPHCPPPPNRSPSRGFRSVPLRGDAKQRGDVSAACVTGRNLATHADWWDPGAEGPVGIIAPARSPAGASRGAHGQDDAPGIRSTYHRPGTAAVYHAEQASTACRERKEKGEEIE